MSATPSLEAFQRDFMRAAVAHERQRRRRLRFAVPLAATVVLTACGTGLAVVLGDPVPAPPAGDLPRAQIPSADTARIEAQADDPGGGLPWAVRVADSPSGMTCAALGRLNGGRFGRLGADGSLRELPLSGSGGCVNLAAETVTPSVRRFDSVGGGVRTVIYGLASDRVERLRLRAPGSHLELRLSERGAFLAVLDGALPTKRMSLLASLRDGGEATYLGPDQGGNK